MQIEFFMLQIERFDSSILKSGLVFLDKNDPNFIFFSKFFMRDEMFWEKSSYKYHLNLKL